MPREGGASSILGVKDTKGACVYWIVRLRGRGQINQRRFFFDALLLPFAAAGATFKDVVKINNYLVDMSHIGIFREVRDEFVNTAAPPASTTVAISQLARPGALFEVEAIAVLPAKAAKAASSKSAKKKGKKKR